MKHRLTKRVCALLWCALVFLSCVPSHAQEASGVSGPAQAGVSPADCRSIINRVKGVDSPTLRAYLYARVAAWLSEVASQDPELEYLAVAAASTGISDIHTNEADISPVPAAWLYASLLDVARRHKPEEAERLRRSYPLARGAKTTEGDRAGAALHAALERAGDPRTSASGLEDATRLVLTGIVPVSVLHGEILNLFAIKSPALSQMLSATLTLEEQRPGTLPLQTMFFLASFYLHDTAPTHLQTRFLSASVNAVRLRSAAPDSGTDERTWAIQLMRRTLPYVQKMTPNLYALASAQLAAIAPDALQGDDVFSRIRNSSNPLSQAITEANFASDAQLKSQLFEMAARLAKEQGKLHQAVELLSSVEESRRGASEDYSSRDELFSALLQDALGRGEVETARLAASKMNLPTNRAAALRRIARHSAMSGNVPDALRSLGEAADALERAKDGKEKAISYFDLATDFAGLDDVRALASIRDGIKAANNITVPAKQEKQPDTFNWSLFPLADSAIKAFQVVARKDRGGALILAETFRPKEFRIAAVVGIYSAAP